MNYIKALIGVLFLYAISMQVHAGEFTGYSHKAYYYDNGYIHFQLNRKLLLNKNVDGCGKFPIPSGCDSEDIAFARMRDRHNDYFANDFFVNSASPFDLVVADCDTRVATCMAKYQNSLALTGTPSASIVNAYAADIDGDSKRDYLVLLNSPKATGDAFVIFSTPGVGGTRSAPVVSQILDATLFGADLSSFKSLQLVDLNGDHLADILVTKMDGREKLVAYADAKGKFFNRSAFVPAANEIPYKYALCNHNITNPAGFQAASLLYSSDCQTVFVPPPELGSSHVTSIDKSYNLDFCPKLKTAASAVNLLTLSLQKLAEKIIALAQQKTSDSTTAALEAQLADARLVVDKSYADYNAALLAQADAEVALSLAEVDLNTCLFTGAVCNLETAAYEQAMSDKLAADKNVDTALSVYMKAVDTVNALETQLANYRSNLIQKDAQLVALFDRFNNMLKLLNGVYKELTQLQGAKVRLEYSLNLNAHLDAYRTANRQLGLTWRFLPVTTINLLTNLEGMNNVNGASVLWLKSQDKNFDYTTFPLDSSNITVNSLPQNSVDLLDASYVDMGLGLAGACAYFTDSKTNPIPSVFSDLPANAPVNIQYVYQTSLPHDYVVKYNLYSLAKTFFTQTLLMNIFEKMPNTSVTDLAQQLVSLSNLSNIDLAQMVDSRQDADWLQIEFDSVSSTQQSALLQQEEIRMEVKARLIRAMLDQVALAYRTQPLQANTPVNLLSVNAQTNSDPCWQRYGSLCRFNNYQLDATSVALDQFRQANDVWKTEQADTQTRIDNVVGTTFVPDPSANPNLIAITSPQLLPSPPSNPQISLTDQSGNVIAAYDTTGLITYVYDGLGRIISERRYSQSPVKPIWSESFDSYPTGLSDLPSGFMSVNNGKLEITSVNTTLPEWHEIRGLRSYTQNQHAIFHFDVTTGSNSVNRYLLVGADGAWGQAGYRRHAAQFDGDSVLVSYYDNGYKEMWLGNVSNNMDYIVDLVSDNLGSTLYVYPKGADRNSGFVDRRSYSDWNSLASIIEAAGIPGTSTAKMYINSLSEWFQDGTSAGGVIAINSSNDPIVEYYYNDDNQLIGRKNVNGTVVTYDYDANGKALTQRLHLIKPRPLLWGQSFDRDTSGFWQIFPQFMQKTNGRLRIFSVNTPDWQWPGINGMRTYQQNSGLVFQATITPGASVLDRYLIIGLEGDSSSGQYRRHALYIDGDSMFSTYFDNGYQDKLLGKMKSNSGYVVQIAMDASGSTLEVREVGSTLALYSDRRNYADWGGMTSFIEAQGFPGASNAYVDVNQISESLYKGQVMGNVVVQNSLLDVISKIN